MNLHKLKQARKTVDKDATMLANRISMLQHEEKKLMKKIEDTRKRANQIMELKKQNEERFNKWVAAEQAKESQLTADRERFKDMKLKNKIEK